MTNDPAGAARGNLRRALLPATLSSVAWLSTLMCLSGLSFPQSLGLAYARVHFLEAAGGLWLSEDEADRGGEHGRQTQRGPLRDREPGSRLRLTS